MRAEEGITNDELDLHLQQFLLQYRVTPHETTELTLAELFVSRKLTTMLDRMRPDLRLEVENRVETQQTQRGDNGRDPDFNVGGHVYARFLYGQRRWRKGTIVAVSGTLLYDVEV